VENRMRVICTRGKIWRGGVPDPRLAFRQYCRPVHQ
jgi:hypothetical protein